MLIAVRKPSAVLFLTVLHLFPQALLLLAYLIRNGSERVVTSAREHIYDLRSLENYHFVGKEIFGAGVAQNDEEKCEA